MSRLRPLGCAIAAAVTLAATPAPATLITVTLTGDSEDISDNADVFGFGANQRLTDKAFVETFLVNSEAVNAFGPQTDTGISSNSIFGGSPPYAVAASLTINGRSFSTIGSNYGSLFTVGDYQLLSDDKVNSSVDNLFYVDLTGAGLPATVYQPVDMALSRAQVANVSFVDNNGQGFFSDAIGNLFPSHLAITQSAAAAVPEPISWALSVIGFGLIGGMSRRRRACSPA